LIFLPYPYPQGRHCIGSKSLTAAADKNPAEKGRVGYTKMHSKKLYADI
jgi:hypothetical protein